MQTIVLGLLNVIGQFFKALLIILQSISWNVSTFFKDATPGAHKKGKKSGGLFTTNFSYWMVFLAASFIALIAGLIGLTAGFTLLLLGQVVIWAFVLIYAAMVALYLTLTGKWHLYMTWWVVGREKRRDQFASITTSLLMASMRLGASSKGFLMTMAPASKYPERPDTKLTFDDDRHVTMIAGSRAGKGRAFIIPNLLHWQGSTIVYDPSGENYKATAEYRRKVLGQKVVLLDPFGVTGDQTQSWNPMAEIDFENDPQAIDKCYMLAESLHHEPSPDPFWTHAPRKLIAMIIAYVGARSIKEQCHLSTVRDLLMTAEPDALWTAMARSDEYRGLIRRFGESNANRHKDELNSTMEITRTAMKWLDSEVMDAFIQQHSFSMRELKEGKTSVYIVLPAGMGDTYKAWLRMLFNAAFDAMQDTSIPKPDDSVLFVMDEFPLLGRMERIKRAAGEAAKFGVKLFICAQDVTQLKEHYKESWETFIANSGLLIMFANNDLESQHYLSNRLGREKYTKVSYTSSQGGDSTSTSTEIREVARPDEVEKQVSRQAGEAYFFPAGHKPMRLKRANYDQWKMGVIPKEKTPEPESKIEDETDTPEADNTSTDRDDQTPPIAAE